MALTLHVCPGDSGAVVWARGDVDTNVAETFQDMMQSVMRRHGPSLLFCPGSRSWTAPACARSC
jgi:hypothetical protein